MSGHRDVDGISRALLDWVGETLPGVTVSAAPVDGNDVADGVTVRLMRLAPLSQPRHADHVRQAMTLDYRIAVRAPEAFTEQQRLADLAFAAMDSAEIELVADPIVELPASVCASLVVRVQAERSRDLPRAPLVREPPVLRLGPLDWIEGTVLGPGDQPIARARITLGNGEIVATTGADGRFRFRALADSTIAATVRARSTRVDAAVEPGKPAIIHLPLEA